MSTGLHALDELADLSLLDKEGKPPTPSRLSSAAALRGLFGTLIREDEASAISRVRIQAMKDGEPPYNQAALVASGQGTRANANFLMGQDLITKANNGYIDIATSPKHLMTIEVEGGEAAERLSYSRIIASELTRTIRKWPGFMPNFLRLVDLFVTHGVGIEYSPNTTDFRFEVTGFSGFHIPRQTPATEEGIAYAIARKDMQVTELYDSIRDEAKAEKMGWNVAAVKAAIGRATTKSSNGELGQLEKLQQQIKSNDLFSTRQFAHVPVLHGWVREFDGTISFFMTEKDCQEGDFLYKQYSQYDCAHDAFNFFCYGVGNGTFHSVRGMGHMIYALVQLHNRLMCQKADGVMMDESIMVQAASANGLQEASLNYMGPFALLSNGLDIVDRKYSSSDRTLPFLGEVKNLMGQTSGRFMAATGGTDSYQNRDSVNSQLETIASGDSGAVDLFYSSWDRTMRKMCERIIKGSKVAKVDRLTAEFHERIAKQGITQEILDSVDHDSTYAYRALGAGSPAARSVAFKRLMEVLPQLDEIGRKRLIYQFVADLVGYQNADYFASESEEPRLNAEGSLAGLENILLMQGNPVPVLAYQMHATHVQIHMPPLLQTLDGIETGQIDPMQALQGLQVSLDHLAKHGEQLAQDPTQAPLYGQVKEALNNLQQVVTNMDRKIKAEQRKQAESGGAEQTQAGQPDQSQAEQQIKLQMAQFKLDLAQRLGELKIANETAKANQSLALSDLKGKQLVQKMG